MKLLKISTKNIIRNNDKIQPMNLLSLKNISNVLAILIVIGFYLAGQYSDIVNTTSIFKEVDLLTGKIILVIIAITIGLFIPQYWMVLLLSCSILLAISLSPELASILNSTQDQVIAAVLVILGFSSIANISRQYRANGAK
jgi:hypothetical protein